MTDVEIPSVLECREVGDLVVVHFKVPRLEGPQAEEAINHLYALVERSKPGGLKLLLNLSALDSLTSQNLGSLVTLKVKVQNTNNRLAMCEPPPSIKALFEAINLLAFCNVFQTQQDAEKSLQLKADGNGTAAAASPADRS
jgi:anti-anti-sigma regulatory factor